MLHTSSAGGYATPLLCLIDFELCRAIADLHLFNVEQRGYDAIGLKVCNHHIGFEVINRRKKKVIEIGGIQTV